MSCPPTICEHASLDDPFQQALAETLPALQNIRDGFGRRPAVSTSALAKLKAIPTPSRNTPPATSPRSASEPPPRPVRTEVPVTHATSSHDILAALRKVTLACEKCPQLVKSRTQVVFGVGNPKADLVFAGSDEDAQGEPFVVRAGQLLTKIIQAMGFTRNDVYIANVLEKLGQPISEKHGSTNLSNTCRATNPVFRCPHEPSRSAAVRVGTMRFS